MARSQESYSKKEREKKRQKRKKDKAEQKEQRKAEKAEGGGTSFEDMIMYVDEFGNLTDTPPDPSKKKKIKAEDIVLGIPPKDDTPVDTTRRGRVKFFNDEKGYGFIVDVDTRDSIFVHINNIFDNTPLQENERVTFEVEMGAKGPNAVNVRLVD